MIKNTFIILIAVLFATNNLQSQGLIKEYKPLKDFDFKVADYIKYNFEERKATYIGKPLSELLKDCEVPIKSTLEHGYARVAGLYGTSFYFESDDVAQYRWINKKGAYDMPEIMIHWSDTIFYPFRGKFRQQILDWYSTQIVSDIETSGKNFSELPKVEMAEELPAPTPCCTPQPGGTLTAEEAKKKKIVKAEFLSLDECDNRLAYADSANHVDTTKISTLFYLAKNSFNTWSLMLRDQYEIYPNNASLVARYSKYPLKKGGANFRNYYNGLFPSATQSFQTVPLSPFGHYRFTAPSGYDFYLTMKNYFSNYSRLLGESYFVAYDGSVYCILISNQNLCNANLHYLNNNFYYSKTSEQLSIRWGFLDGGRMQDEFLDAFIRLYDEGSHFSKEDAYNAAFAYIMEGRGVELYRRAPNETEFKRYNTTPLYEGGSSKISGFYSTIK